MIRVPLRESRTLHHDGNGRWGAGKVMVRAAPPGTRIETVIEWLRRDFAAREQGLQRAEV